MLRDIDNPNDLECEAAPTAREMLALAVITWCGAGLLLYGAFALGRMTGFL